MVTRMDGDVGRILNRIRERHLEENTIVFFCSDNGAPGVTDDGRFHSGSDFRGQKGTFYEGGIRVPMIVRWPGQVPAGVVSRKVWYFADFLPTAAESRGPRSLPALDGVSILPTLLGQPQELAGRLLYWENRSGQAARVDDWKAVRPAFGQKLELYDLSRDPRETHDLAGQNPEVVTRIETAMKAARVPSANYPTELIGEESEAKGRSTMKPNQLLVVAVALLAGLIGFRSAVADDRPAAAPQYRLDPCRRCLAAHRLLRRDGHRNAPPRSPGP